MAGQKQNRMPGAREVLEQYGSIIFRVARSYAHSAADADDLAQDISIQVWRSLSNYDPSRKLSTWVYRVALNVALSHQRKEVRRKQQAAGLNDGWPPKPDPASPLQAERVQQLQDWIRRLPPLDRALMLLHLDAFSHQEIAAALGISASNAGTKISRLKARMAKDLSPAK
ncbi:RNA polymerase sigma factor [Phaeodactylibacter luteus]|nr:RNA polymerase sigma factor [Phaeodactylibacter luteus]